MKITGSEVLSNGFLMVSHWFPSETLGRSFGHTSRLKAPADPVYTVKVYPSNDGSPPNNGLRVYEKRSLSQPCGG